MEIKIMILGISLFVGSSLTARVTTNGLTLYRWMGLSPTTGITFTGNRDLSYFGSDLSSGLYTYTLVADGKVVATKKMVKE